MLAILEPTVGQAGLPITIAYVKNSKKGKKFGTTLILSMLQDKVK